MAGKRLLNPWKVQIQGELAPITGFSAKDLVLTQKIRKNPKNLSL